MSDRKRILARLEDAVPLLEGTPLENQQVQQQYAEGILAEAVGLSTNKVSELIRVKDKSTSILRPEIPRMEYFQPYAAVNVLVSLLGGAAAAGL